MKRSKAAPANVAQRWATFTAAMKGEGHRVGEAASGPAVPLAPPSGYRAGPMMKRSTPKPRRRPKPQGGPRTYGRLQRALDDAARREIEAALRETDGAVVAAAKLLGISKVALWKRMRALGIDTPV